MEESKSSGVVEVIKRSMNDEAFEEAIKLTKKAFESYEVDKDVAERIKSDMEKKFDGSWYVSPQHNFVSFFFRISTHTHTHTHTHTTHHMHSRHCIVGKNFGCSVEFDPLAMTAFKMANKSVFLFRSPKE